MRPAAPSQGPTRRFQTVDDAMQHYGQRTNPPKPETLLAQYGYLRGEVESCLAAQLQILSFGTATLGLVAGAAFVGSEGVFRSDVLVVFLPLLAYLTLTIWFAEVMRMLRAGSFMLTLEKRLDEAGDGALAWEAEVWAGRTRYSVAHTRIRPYYSLFDPDQLRLVSVSLLFFTIAGASIAMGWADATAGQRWFAVAAGALALLVVLLLYHLRLEQVAEMFDVEERPALTRFIARLADLLDHDLHAPRTPPSPGRFPD